MFIQWGDLYMFKTFLLLGLVLGNLAHAQLTVGSFDKIESHSIVKSFVKNPSCLKNTNNITVSAGAKARLATGGLDNGYSCQWNPTASTQTLKFDSKVFDTALKYKECYSSFYYKGDASLVKAYIKVGSNKITSDIQLANATDSKLVELNYNCGDLSSTPEIYLEATGDAANVEYVVNAHGVAQNIAQLSQAELVGTITWAKTAACAWSLQNASFSNFTADADCPTPTVTGNIAAPATKVPGFTLTNRKVGNYYVVAQGAFLQYGGNQSRHGYRFSNGTLNTNENTIAIGGASGSLPLGSISGSFSSTSALGSDAWQIQAYSPATDTISIDPSLSDLSIQVYYFPSVVDKAIKIGTEAWKVDANIGGSNVTLSSSSISTYTEATNASLDLVNNPGLGNIPAQIACSGTNPSTGLTCAAGSESVGIAFNLPDGYSEVLACANFPYEISYGSAASFYGTFQMVETPNNSQTILQEGKTRVGSTISTPSGVSGAKGFPIRLCGNFSFTSSGLKTLRVMYEQSVTNAVTPIIHADRNASLGNKDIHWEVYPLTIGKPNPIILNSVSTTTPTPMKIDAASINCQVSTTVTNLTGAGWTATNYSGTTTSGSCTLSFNTPYLSTPICTHAASSGNKQMSIDSITTTGLVLHCYSGGANCNNDTHKVMCMGQK